MELHHHLTGRRVRIGLFVLFHGLYALTSSGNAFRIPDEFEVYFQVEHLVDAGDLSVPQAVALRQPVVVDGKVVGSDTMFFGKFGLDGKPYAPYGPLAAVLAMPHHLAGRALASILGIERVPQPQGLAWVIFVGGVTMLATATAGALTVVGFHRAAIALGTSPLIALLLSLVLGGATVLWPYATSMFSEAFLAAAFMWAAALLLEARTASRPAASVAIAAVLIVVAGLTKVTSLIVAPAFVAAVLAERSLTARQRWRVAMVIGGAIALATALQLGWNAYRFGSPFDLGYDWGETIKVLPARAFAVADIPRGLAVLLVAPGKSMFVWSPILIISLLNASATWRRDRALAMGLLSASVVGLLVYAAYLFPEGGYAHGPRHLVPIVPLLALAAAGPATRAQRPALIYACAAAGVVMAFMATRVSYLEDQALRRDANGRAVANYYEEIEPAPGRPSNRYRLGHIPFVTAMKTPGWSQSAILGQGPDHFYKHLQQARRQLPDGQSIPASLPVIWQGLWMVITLGGALHLARLFNGMRVPVEKGDGDGVGSAMQELRTSPVLAVVERWMPVIVLLLSAILIGSELNQGWVPHDEGTLGQAAERVLSGQVPHRDFDDTYTGALAYLLAGSFTLGPIASTTMRVPLFIFAMLWVAAFHLLARRFAPPFGAALVTMTAVVWSVPNYPAPMPSWFNLFFATFGALALVHGLERSERRWFALAGACGAISFLFKLSGVFFFLGAGLVLIASTFRAKSDAAATSRSRSGAVLATMLLAVPVIVLSIPISRVGTSEVFRFLLPLVLLAGALTWREWAAGDATATARLRSLLEPLAPLILGAALPIGVYAIFLLSAGALPATIDGVLVRPFRRLDSGMMHPPPPTELLYAVVIGVLLTTQWRSARIAGAVTALLAVVFAAIIYASGTNPTVYAMAVLSAWGLPVVAAAAAAWLIVRGGSSAGSNAVAAVAVAAVATSTLLVEFPFAAPIYMFYTVPLAMLALAGITRAMGRRAVLLQTVVAAFFLVFGLMRVNPGAVESFGSRFRPTDETVRLKLARGGLRVRAADAARYEAVIGVIQSLAAGRTLWAGPDSPEIYFLSGMPNQTRTLIDFLDEEAVPLIERVHRANATLVALNLRPDFSGAPDEATVEALRAEFPNVRVVAGYLVCWR